MCRLLRRDIQAFIYDSTTLEYEVGKDDGCKLKTVGKRIAETGYGVAFPKRSPWVKEVDGALLQLQENGWLFVFYFIFAACAPDNCSSIEGQLFVVHESNTSLL